MRKTARPGKCGGRPVTGVPTADAPRAKMKANAVTSFLFVLFSTSVCSQENGIFNLIQIGQTKEEIENILGQPNETNINTKIEENIWGPEEEFWHKIPLNSEFEVWSYKNKKGDLRLYFIGNRKRLDYKAFSPKGVVYESVQ